MCFALKASQLGCFRNVHRVNSVMKSLHIKQWPEKRVLKFFPTEIFMSLLLSALEPKFYLSDPQSRPISITGGKQNYVFSRTVHGCLEHLLLVSPSFPFPFEPLHSEISYWKLCDSQDMSGTL